MNSRSWNELVNKNDSKFYHIYEWGILLEYVHGHRLIYLKEDNNILPLAYVKSILFGNRLISLPFADYGGPCLANNKSIDILITEAEETAKKLDVDFIEIRSPSEVSFESLIEHGFIKRDDYFTFQLRLDSQLDKLWDSIGKKNRNMVRKAEKKSIKIIRASDIDDLKLFYIIYLDTMKRLGSPPQPYKFFKEIWHLFYPNRILLLLATCGTEYVAGSLFFLHKNIIHHSYNCSLKEHLGSGQNNMMLWYAIKWGNENGFKYLDFGRTRENAGNVLFKKRWGGQLVMMPYFYKFYKKELNERQEMHYMKLSRIWSKYMPMKITNKIGPWIIGQIG